MTTIRLAFAPATTYAELARRNVEVTWREALGQPAFSALLIGALVTMAGTERVTVVDVALATVTLGRRAWPSGDCRGNRDRGSQPPQRQDDPRARFVLCRTSTVVALAAHGRSVGHCVRVDLRGFARPCADASRAHRWTATIISAFCRTVLNATPSEARRLTALHQSVIWGTGVVSACFAIGFLQRVFAVLTP